MMPQLGESVETGTIARWHKAAGDPIAVDEPLYEVSSDKVTMEVPSLVAGFVREIIATEGTEVAVGSVIARIAAHHDDARLSPAVRRLLREHGLDSASIVGTAVDGRITKADVLAFAAASAKPHAAPTEAPASSPQSRRIPLSRAQRHAIERMSAAQHRAVNVFSVVEVDMEAVALERVRRGLTYLPFVALATITALRSYERLNASLDETLAAIDIHDGVHLGVAVDLAERGLVVPVIRNAHELMLADLAREIARLANGARAATLPMEDYAGSTFTITNNGAFGTLMTAPVLNAPNVAIVSTDAVELRPVVVGCDIVARHRMYLCMTWDHRACDGSTAARFLGEVKGNLETWDWPTR